jgi:hypothetical protein
MSDYAGDDSSRSSELPSYRGIMAVDIASFSSGPSARLPDLSAVIPDILEMAFSRCALPGIWKSRRFPQATGDGYVFGVQPENVPFLIDPLLDRLQEVLEEQDRVLRARDRGLRLRLRASIHIGPVPDRGDERRDRIGTPTNDTFRLLDSTPVKGALTQSSPDVTLLAAIVSQRVYEDVIRAGYTGLHPDSFNPVTADVPGKGFVQPGWMYVPRPSRGGQADAGERAGQGTDSPGSQAPQSGRSVLNTISGKVGQAVMAERIDGNVSFQGSPGYPGQSGGFPRRDGPE